MEVIKTENEFVAPHFIDELGEDGLTLHEVSRGLQATHQHVRDRLENLIRKGAISLAHAITCPNETNGLPVNSYVLTVEDSKMLAASYDNEAGFGYRRFLIQCEKKLKEVLTPKLPSHLETAKMLVSALEENERLSKENLVLVPKAEMADKLLLSDALILIKDLAHQLKKNGVDIGEQRLFAWMRDQGYMQKSLMQNKPTQKALDLGVLSPVETIVNPPGRLPWISITTKVTAKGQDYFLRKFAVLSSPPAC